MGALCWALAPAAACANEGSNLIANPSLETGTTVPQSWVKSSWGANNAAFTYPAEPAADGSRAARIDITSYSSGDAKWFFNEVAVIAGASYHFLDAYLATVPTAVTVRYHLSDGSYTYQTIATPPASSTYARVDVAFSIPANVTSITVFHLIHAAGSLTVDNFELHQNLPPGTTGNLVTNPSLETATTNPAVPYAWSKGGWGTNTPVFTYPVAGLVGQRAASVAITSYTSGDAKWYFSEAPVTPGTAYTFADTYVGNVDTWVVTQFRLSNGSFVYTSSNLVMPSSAAQGYSATYIAPPNAITATVFHLLKSVGSLTVDNDSLTPQPAGYALFPQGTVSIVFDDGYSDTMQTAMPILDAAGYKTTQYITTGFLGSAGHVSTSDVLTMQANGHEIGAHTRTHPDLTTLSPSQLTSEVSGSLQDLLAIGATPVKTFAYPYGAFNSTVVQAVQNAGFAAAVDSTPGGNLTTDDKFTLRRFSNTNATTFDQVKSAIDEAVASKTWLILLFHHVDYSGTAYSVTPDLFQQIIGYLQSNNVSVVTTSAALQMISP